MGFIGDFNPAVALPVLLLLLSITGAVVASQGLFVLDKTEQVVRTDAGDVRVVRGLGSWEHPKPINLAFITMEPDTLFIPQYLDSGLVLFVRRGEAKIGWIYKDELVEKNLKHGDINVIPAGSTFYIVNTGKGQRLKIIAAIDTSESLGFGASYQPFYIGGGLYPTSVLTGFDPVTLATAYNVTVEDLAKVFGTSAGGPIVFITGKAAEKTRELASMMHRKAGCSVGDEDEDEQENDEKWSWRKLLNSVLGAGHDDRSWMGKKEEPVGAPDSYNLYDSDPGYKNKHGWSIAVDKTHYKPLKKSDVGVYLVTLNAGVMMAPHVNPRATEYGVVLSGSVIVQVVFPNGTSAMNAELHEGDVFWVPRYFPFCHIATRSGPVKLFGFATSAKPNHPQFLAGKRSVLATMMGPELAAALGTKESLKKFVGSQEFDVFLPPWPPAEKREEREQLPELIKTRVGM